MGSVRRVSELVCRHPWLAVVAFAGLYGLQTNGEAEFRTISAAPFVVNLPAQDQYLYGSPFTFLLGSYYQHHGLDYAWAFFTVNTLGLAAFFSSLHALIVCQFQRGSRGAAALVFFSSPLLFVLLSWIGKSDAYLLAFYFLFRLTGSRFTQLLLCALMTVCHRELAVVVLLVHLCLEPGRWRQAALGLLAGEAAVYLYTHALLSSVPASRAGFVVDHAAELWRNFRSHPMLHVIGTFGPFWVYAWSRVFQTPARAFVFSVALLLSAASFDFTRIFAIVSTPLMLAMTSDVVTGKTAGTDGTAGGGVGLHVLWPLMFVQFQCAGARLLLAQGTRIGLGG